MTRIAMILPTLNSIGGAERQVMLLAKELSSRGWQVTVIALAGSPNESTHELAAAGVAWLSLEMRKAWIDPRGWRRYWNWASIHRPEIVHTHLPHATWFARCIRFIAPVAVQVDTIHTSRVGGLLWRVTYRLTRRQTDHVTCVSAAVIHTAIATGLAPRQNLSVIPNGVILPPLAPSPVRPDPAAPCPSMPESRAFQWLAVGRLAPVKDYPTLIRAFAALPGEPLLTIAGEGPQKLALCQLASQLGMNSRIRFAGFQSDIQPLLDTADAFVLASLWEGLPVSVLEAAAAALPAVVTDGAGTREAILPNETGLIVPVGDAPALTAAMAEIMTMTPWQRRAMGQCARAFVEQHFSLSAVVDRWEQLYGQLLTRHPNPSRHGFSGLSGQT